MILTTAAALYLACAPITISATADANDHDPYQRAVEVLRFSFENEGGRPYDGDRDFDGQPDDWTRRKGVMFPDYVISEIDQHSGQHGSQSLRIKVNGGQATIYSPVNQHVGKIDSLHSYIFQGWIRTQGLENDAAMISVSFLNHRRQRVQRFLSQPVTGTHADWQLVRIGPIRPQDNVRFVAIGCHLVQGKKMDISGDVWFDNLWLGQLPQLTLISNFHTHFVKPRSEVVVRSQVSGLDPGRVYQLQMQLEDSNSEVIASETYPLQAVEPTSEEVNEDGSPPRREPIEWKLPPQPYGFYRVQSTLQDGTGAAIISKQSSIAVMDLLPGGEVPDGEFGWSVDNGAQNQTLADLANIAGEAGINWLKYPLWQSVYDEDPEASSRISSLLETLAQRGITPVGLLSDPPPELRMKFARNWTGFSEIFSMPTSFWSPSLEPVIAHYWSNVRHWQLGSEADISFVGLSRLPETLSVVKKELDRIGRDTHIGVHWSWDTPLPPRRRLPQSFFSISNQEPLLPAELVDKLNAAKASGSPRWVLIKPLPESRHTPEERGTDLVSQMVAAKIGGAEVIFAQSVVDKEYGLLNPDGSPTVLFLPWRTTALALKGTEYLGSLNMPGGSLNHVFVRNGEVVLVVWKEFPDPDAPPSSNNRKADQETIVEEMYLGENAVVVDVWGRRKPLQRNEVTGRQQLTVGYTPSIVRGCSEAIARWRMAVRFANGKVGSVQGVHSDATLGKNTFRQGVSGTVTLNLPLEARGRNGWQIEPSSWQIQMAPDESYKLPVEFTLPQHVKLGNLDLSIDFEINADRPYKFTVHRPYQIGLGDVVIKVIDRKLKDGRLEIEQIILNKTKNPVEMLNFHCSLFVPGIRRRKQFVTKLGSGEDHKFYYVPDAESLRGKELWLRANQEGGLRVLNYTWKVGENWDTAAADDDE